MATLKRRLPFTVLALGLTSFFTDVSADMIFPLLPLLLTESLRAGPTFLGMVEGVADTVASLLKLVSGYLSDRVARRKPLVVFGYGLASAARPLVAFAVAPWHIFIIRISDRIGKGLRSAPRDALIADSTLPGEAGRAFGFHRAMDHAGAVVGPLVAAALLGLGFELRSVFLLAAIPGFASVAIVLAIREDVAARRRQVALSAEPARPSGAPTPRSLRNYFLILLLFSLGNSSDVFLLLRARELGLSQAAIPALWSLLHVTKLVSAYYGGMLSDRVRRVRVIVGGWVVYALVYLGLAVAETPSAAWVLFAIYGIYYGLTEPAEKALVRDLALPSGRGRAYGYYNFIVGVSALPASLLTAWLWHSFGPRVALGAGAALAAVASGLLLVWSARRESIGHRAEGS